MDLLERDHQLDVLRCLLGRAASGSGCLLLVGGEAGVGKSALLRSFLDKARPRSRVLIGNCDALSTPRALGPLVDIADPALGQLLDEDAPRDLLFRSLLSSLSKRERPTLLVIEDAHWADEATLDLLRFLGRRVEATHGLVIVTYRDDEIGPRHPFRRVLGELATAAAVQRLTIEPLSMQAVDALAQGSGLNAAELYDRTGGNPFFVTEVLAVGEAVPETVRDAVLARASRLDQPAWGLLETVAVAGAAVTSDVLHTLAKPGPGELEACLETGILMADGQTLSFRHELARDAILSAIAPPRKQALHALILRTLEAEPLPLRNAARLAHHAEAAGDACAVMRHAREAAHAAEQLGAYREAASQYARLLRFADSLAPAQRACLYEARSWACYLTAQIDQAVLARRAALAIWERLGDTLRIGANRCHLATLLWAEAKIGDAEREAEAAIALLEQLEPGPELAMAYGTLARLLGTTLADDEAIKLAEKAIALAERVGTTDSHIDALLTAGEARLARGLIECGQRQIELAMKLAEDAALDSVTARAYISLGYGFESCGRLDLAEQHLELGITYCVERDLDLPLHHLTALLARCHCRLGNWDTAWELATSVLAEEDSAPGTRFDALVVAGTLLARRGEPGAADTLDEALALATSSECIYFLGPARAARAEAAFLRGNLALTVAEASAAYDLASDRQHRWHLGELAYWRWKGGESLAGPANFAVPFARQIAGEWACAADAWETLGQPYEAARARAEGNDESALRAALETFDRLDARPAAAAVRARLRAMGARGIPRGPRSSTRSHAAGLTAREADVLALLAKNLSNREIAGRLYLSARTVENHISVIRAKFAATSRAEAVAAARRAGVLPQSE